MIKCTQELPFGGQVTFPLGGGDAYDYIWRIVSILPGNLGSYFSMHHA